MVDEYRNNCTVYHPLALRTSAENYESYEKRTIIALVQELIQKSKTLSRCVPLNNFFLSAFTKVYISPSIDEN